MINKKYHRGSFRLDSDAKSFQMTGFRWRDAPALFVSLTLSFFLSTGINLGVAFLAFLSRDAMLIVNGVTIGYLIGVWVGARRTDSEALRRKESGLPQVLPLSDRVKVIADEPNRLVEAIKVYREESGVGLAEAIATVEAYINR